MNWRDWKQRERWAFSLNLVVVLCVVGLTAATVKKVWFSHTSPQPLVTDIEPVVVDDWQSIASEGHLWGPAEADVVVTVFSNFECGACRAFATGPGAVIRAESSRVAYRFRHWPLDYLRFSKPAAVASECAAREGRFWEFHDLVYAKQDSLGLKSVASFAAEAGVHDIESFMTCYEDEETLALVERDRAVAEAVGGTGAPTVIIDGMRFQRQPTTEEIREYLAEHTIIEIAEPEHLPERHLEVVSKIDGEEHMLVPVGWVQLLPNGGVAFSQQQDGQFVVADSAGEVRFRFGGRGAGPGEFRRLSHAGVRGDTLWAFDAMLSRLTFVDLGGELVRTELVPNVKGSGDIPDLAQVAPRAVLSDGTLYALGIPTRGPMADLIGEIYHFFRVTPDWVADAVVEKVPYQPMVYLRRGGEHAMVTVPFARPPIHVISPDGGYSAVVVANQSGHNRGRFSVRVSSTRGEKLYGRSFSFNARAIPRQRMDSALAAIRADGRRELYQELRRRELPEVYAPFVRGVLESNGTLWLRRVYERDYLVCDSTGEPIARAIPPDGVFVLAADSSLVWGIERDALGVESVVRMRVR